MKKAVIFLLTVIIFSQGAKYLLAAPGDADDPVVTLSYIKQILLPDIEQKINSSSAAVFKVVDVPQGSKVILDAGTEIILRMGSATVIATEKGGLADVTSGVDLQHESAVPANSLLIAPLADGRGIHATDNVILMIKGGYTIQ
ncbi:MAG: hypothetical protein PHF89_00035 [Eubacteriales bacterium]|nr:hypothetical protein [Eubacteriales bacterium]